MLSGPSSAIFAINDTAQKETSKNIKDLIHVSLLSFIKNQITLFFSEDDDVKRPYKCEICGGKFVQEKYLRIHKRSHSSAIFNNN